MDRFLHLNFSFLRCRTLRPILAFVWICGLVSGAFISLSADEFLASTMHALIRSDMSISGLLAALFLPFLISFFAVYLSQNWLLLIVAFFKAFLFAYTGAGLILSFDAAGWLLCLLLLFGDVLTLPALWLLWLRCLHSSGRSAWCSSIPSVIVAGFAGIFEYCVVAPFLASLI